jgi:hypothetical protein
MKKTCALLLLLAGCGGVTAVKQASRPASPGCQWTPLEDSQLGLALLVEQCEGPLARKWLVEDSVLREATMQGEAGKGMPVIEVFAKPADQPVEEAIREKIVAALPPEQRAGCVVRSANKEKTPEWEPQKWKIVPSGEYLIRARQLQVTEPGVEVCGPYGEMEALNYFEARPAESRTKYWFVRAGQGKPMFDEQSIRVKGH